jgi:hypothetical protein
VKAFRSLAEPANLRDQHESLYAIEIYFHGLRAIWGGLSGTDILPQFDRYHTRPP